MNKRKMADSSKYAAEFADAQRDMTRRRVRLLCGLTIAVYIATSALGWLMDPGSVRREEFLTWIILIAAAFVAVLVNRRTRTLAQAKAVAFSFSAALVATIVALFSIYPEYLAWAPSIYALTLFLIVFAIPWNTGEALAVGGAHIMGLTLMYAAAGALRADGEYADGAVFICVALAIAAIIKRRDNEREERSFALMKDLEARNEEMESELALARDIHKTLVPRSTSTDRAQIAVNYIPMTAVGGDYATFRVTQERNLFFLVGDITGHGVPAALLVNRIYGEVEALVARNPLPGQLLRDLDAFVREHFGDTRMYFSVCSGLLDFSTKKLHYSNYGHPPQIVHQRRGNRIRRLESQTCPLGISLDDADAVLYEGILDFDDGDRIVLFTDGLTETKGADGDFYGMKRLERFVQEHGRLAPTLFNTALLADLGRYRVGPVTDDTFLLSIAIR